MVALARQAEGAWGAPWRPGARHHGNDVRQGTQPWLDGGDARPRSRPRGGYLMACRTGLVRACLANYIHSSSPNDEQEARGGACTFRRWRPWWSLHLPEMRSNYGKISRWGVTYCYGLLFLLTARAGGYKRYACNFAGELNRWERAVPLAGTFADDRADEYGRRFL